MRKKLLLSIGFSLGATALTAVTVGWMGRPQEQALLSPLNETERQGVLQNLRAAEPSTPRKELAQQLVKWLEEQEPERLAWHEVEALRRDLEQTREQMRRADCQHTSALAQLRDEHRALRQQRDDSAQRVQHLERMVNLLGEQVREKRSELERLHLAATVKESALAEHVDRQQALVAAQQIQLADLESELTRTSKALVAQEALTGRSEEDLARLRRHHAALLAQQEQSSWALQELAAQKSSLQKSAWIAQEALDGIQQERTQLEHELAALKQIDLLQKADLLELQQAYGSAVAARSGLEREVLVAREALRQAELLAGLPHSDEHWLARFVELQMELEGAWSEAGGAGTGHPVAQALRHALAGMRDVGDQMKQALQAKQALDLLVAQRDAQLAALEAEVSQTHQLRQSLQTLAQEHIQLTAALAQQQERAAAEAAPRSVASDLRTWLAHAVEQVASLSSQRGLSSRAVRLREEMEAIAATAHEEWSPLAECCSRWAQEISSLDTELRQQLETSGAALELARQEHQTGQQQLQETHSVLEATQQQWAQSLAKSRRHLQSMDLEREQEDTAPETIASITARTVLSQEELEQRILELEARLEAKTLACVELTASVAAMEQTLNAQQGQIAKASQERVHLEQLANPGLADSAEELRELTEQLAAVSLSLEQQRAARDQLMIDYQALQVLHQAQTSHFQSLVAQLESSQQALLESTRADAELAREQIAQLDASLSSSKAELASRAEELEQSKRMLAQLESDAAQRVQALTAQKEQELANWRVSAEAQIDALRQQLTEREAVLQELASRKEVQQLAFRETVEERQAKIDALEQQLEQQNMVLAAVRQEVTDREIGIAELSQRIERVETGRRELEQALAQQVQELHGTEGHLLEQNAQLAAAQKERELMEAALSQLQALRLDQMLAQARNDLHATQAQLHGLEARLEQQAQEGLRFQELLASSEKALALAHQERLDLAARREADSEEMGQLRAQLSQLEMRARDAEEARLAAAEQLSNWENTRYEQRYHEAVAHAEQLELELAAATDSAQRQARHSQTLEQTLAVRQHEAQANADAQQRIADDLRLQIARLEQVQEERTQQLLAEQSAKCERIEVLEGQLAQALLQTQALQQNSEQLQLALEQLRASDWEGRALQAEQQHLVLTQQHHAMEQRLRSLEAEQHQREMALASLQEHSERVQRELQQQSLSIQQELQAQLEQERQQTTLELATLRQSLDNQTQRLAAAEAEASHSALALEAARQESQQVQQQLAAQLNQSWKQRLDTTLAELGQARQELALIQDERRTREGRLEQLEADLRLALLQQEQQRSEWQEELNQQIALVEQQALRQQLQLEQRVADLQTALANAQSSEADVSHCLQRVQTELASTQEQLTSLAMAREASEQQRQQETSSLREKAHGLEGRYQQMIASLRTEHDHRLATVSELESQVALRDQALEGQLKSLERAHRLLEDTREQSSQLASRLRELETQLASSEKTALTAQSTAQTLRQALEQKEQQVTSLAREAQDQARRAELAQQLRVDLEQQLAIAQQKELAALASSNARIDDAQGEIARLKALIEHMRLHGQDRDAERQELRSELLAAQEQLAHLSRSRREMQTSLLEQGARAELLEQQSDRLQAILRESQVAREENEQQIAMLQRELDHRQRLLDEEDRRFRSLEESLIHERNQVALLEARLAALSNQQIPQLSLAPEHGRFHLVRQGETLRDIAKRYYGDVREVVRVRRANARLLADQQEPASGSLLVIP
jgi:chromosome segregation ATPase